VNKGLAIARAQRIDFLVAVGGGSSMDCAKGINFLFTNGGAMADYQGLGKATKPMLPSIGVPATAGTGSEGQSFALIADEQTHMKMACGDRKAAFRVAILDPEVTVSQPTSVTAITGIDALAHALESYVCTTRNTLSQVFAREAWRLLEPNLETALREPGNLDARSAMQLGAHFAGIAIENSMLGACHACANPLTAHYGLTHGIAIGILLPHVIRFNSSAVGSLYGDLAREAGLLNGDLGVAGEALAQRISSLLTTAGLPTNLTGSGVSPGIIPVLADEAARQWTGKFNPRPVNEAAFIQLYESAL
jgi:alcohol dehydrogenase